MSTAPQEDQAAETKHSICLPVVVKVDDINDRYCAHLLIDGQPDYTLLGECRFGESTSGDSEQQKQVAIDDLRNKIRQKLGVG